MKALNYLIKKFNTIFLVFFFNQNKKQNFKSFEPPSTTTTMMTFSSGNGRGRSLTDTWHRPVPCVYVCGAWHCMFQTRTFIDDLWHWLCRWRRHRRCWVGVVNIISASDAGWRVAGEKLSWVRGRKIVWLNPYSTLIVCSITLCICIIGLIRWRVTLRGFPLKGQQFVVRITPPLDIQVRNMLWNDSLYIVGKQWETFQIIGLVVFIFKIRKCTDEFYFTNQMYICRCNGYLIWIKNMCVHSCANKQMGNYFFL